MLKPKPQRTPRAVGAWTEPLHPGQIIKRRFFDPLNVTQREFCKEHGIETSKFSELLRGKRDITAETAMELSDAFGVSAMAFMNLQSRHNLEMAKRITEESPGSSSGHAS